MLQKAALDLVARKITASLQVDGLSLADALTDEDRLHATAASRSARPSTG